MHALLTLFVGWLFAMGLGISGMTDVSKVIGFLNIRGEWDPSLMGVMGGAIIVYSIAYRLIHRKRVEPIIEQKFRIPTRTDIDFRLVAGAAMFGIGWGTAGICPGPGITSMATGAQTSIAFVAAMILGMFAHQVLNARGQAAKAEPAKA